MRSDSQSKRYFMKAGQLDLVYEFGSLRWIKLGGIEILRMIYSAVRDHNWKTIPPVVLEEDIQISDNSFRVKLKVEYHAGAVHFVANYQISGGENNIKFEFNGIAHADFMANRIGFCVLHPIRECTGKAGTVIHTDGNSSDFIFPELICANQPVKNVQSIIWEPAFGITATLKLSGDVFEMEDQRNWTDASYKTYCTSLELPFPRVIKIDDTVYQVVELTVKNANPKKESSSDYVFSWNNGELFPIPELGTAVSSQKENLTRQEVVLLKKLPLNHLRVEIRMKNPSFINDLEKASRDGKLLACPLFVVLYLSEDYLNDYQEFVESCHELKVQLSHLLTINLNHLPFDHLSELSPLIRKDFPGTLIGTGVNAYFAELNRTQPSAEKADFVSFTISPQVHAFDDDSLIENIEGQAEVIRSAKKLYPGKPIIVSPVSLKERFSVVATAEEPETESQTIPDSVDLRQRSLFAASWTLGSLKQLTQGGAKMVTYYETLGWRGLLDRDYDDNEIFPVYTVLKELTGYSDVVQSTSSHPLSFEGLVVHAENKLKMFLFNFTPDNIEIRIEPAIQHENIYSLAYSTPMEFRGEKLILRGRDLAVLVLQNNI